MADTTLGNSVLKPVAIAPQCIVAAHIKKHVVAGRHVRQQHLECFEGSSIERNVPLLTVLTPRHSQQSSLEIHVRPLCSVLLAAPHARVHGYVQLWYMEWVFGSDHCPKARFLTLAMLETILLGSQRRVLLQVAHPGIVFLSHVEHPRRIGLDLSVLLREAIGEFDER